jgi:hypothetical protein
MGRAPEILEAIGRQLGTANRKKQWTASTSPPTHQETATSNFESERFRGWVELGPSQFEIGNYDADKRSVNQGAAGHQRKKSKRIGPLCAIGTPYGSVALSFT